MLAKAKELCIILWCTLVHLIPNCGNVTGIFLPLILCFNSMVHQSVFLLNVGLYLIYKRKKFIPHAFGKTKQNKTHSLYLFCFVSFVFVFVTSKSISSFFPDIYKQCAKLTHLWAKNESTYTYAHGYVKQTVSSLALYLFAQVLRCAWKWIQCWNLRNSPQVHKLMVNTCNQTLQWCELVNCWALCLMLKTDFCKVMLKYLLLRCWMIMFHNFLP